MISGRFELFLDLLYVAILSNFADDLSKDISGAKLAKYIVCRQRITYARFMDTPIDGEY